MLEQKFAAVIGELQVQNVLLQAQLEVARQRIAELESKLKPEPEPENG